MKQNSDEWLEWRRKGIGASDAPIILGISPCSTAYKLWEEKTGKVIPDQDANKYITEKGHRLEPKARAMYEVQTGVIAPDTLAEKEGTPWRASLDGYSKEHNRNVEIKYVGQGEKWQMAVEGKIPDYYEAQIQWQLFVSGADSCDYVAFNEKDFEIKIINVLPDLKFIESMVKKVEAFWKLVQEDKEPPLSDRDYKKIRNRNLRDQIKEYNELKKQAKDIKKKMEDMKEKIVSNDLIKHNRMMCDEGKVIEKTRKGNVDYAKIMEEHLPEIDVDKYRKASTTYMEIL